MIPIVLHDPERVANLLSQAYVYAAYQRYTICQNPLGYYLVNPDGKTALTIAGMIVHTSTPQDAGALIDHMRVVTRRITPTSTAARRSPTATTKKSSTSDSRTKAASSSSKRARRTTTSPR